MSSMGDNSIIINCTCGIMIPDDEIQFSNGCNELGEDYYEGIAECSCGKEYEWSEWGECDNLEQAKKDLLDFINN